MIRVLLDSKETKVVIVLQLHQFLLAVNVQVCQHLTSLKELVSVANASIGSDVTSLEKVLWDAWKRLWAKRSARRTSSRTMSEVTRVVVARRLTKRSW